MFHWLVTPSAFFINNSPINVALGISAVYAFIRYNKIGKMVDGVMIALCYIVLIGCLSHDKNFHIHVNHISNWVIASVSLITIAMAIIDLEFKRQKNKAENNICILPTVVYTLEKIPSWELVQKFVKFTNENDELIAKNTYDFIDHFLYSLRIAHPSFDQLPKEEQQQMINSYSSTAAEWEEFASRADNDTQKQWFLQKAKEARESSSGRSI
jgi:hypothetical protein